MSRRKQAKPQQLRSEEEQEEEEQEEQEEQEEEEEAGWSAATCRMGAACPAVEVGGGCRGREEGHSCARCCSQFFSWAELNEHQGLCIEDPLVTPGQPYPAPSAASSDSSTNTAFELTNDSGDQLEAGREWEQELEASSPPTPGSAKSPPPQTSAAGSFWVPSTNVSLEILHSTRVAVAQFSQGTSGSRLGAKAASAAIPVILQHLLALQQQQVQQLRLIEQICSQVAVMNRQPAQTALNPASRSLTSDPGVTPPPVLPLSGTMPSSINGQAAVSLPQSLASPALCGQSSFTSASPEGSGSTLCSGLLPTSQAGFLSPPPSVPFLPQSPPSGVIFPNPLTSIATTASALDPLAALTKQRKGHLSTVSLFETKPSPEEPFFKHKCRFCAKVFGSDSALQIHLRSHTGERPFKCNICGNRFSTKGNLKVHFQRHKDKYPHVQMNPFPVPEYLDNVPTSSGIPYGMSVPPEKTASSWLDSKSGVATLDSTVALPLSSAVASVRGSAEWLGVTAAVKSPFQAAPGECHQSSEAGFFPVSQSETSKILKTDEAQLPQSCALSLQPEPDPIPSSSPPLLHLTDSPQMSETSKLQQLVESIDKKITDPNTCVLCHRTLSCQSALRMHYRVHTGERPFRCNVCGRAFTTKGNLKSHVAVHRENPPLQTQHSCPICQKKFTNAVSLQQHIRQHTDSQISDGIELTDDIPMEDEEEEEEVENMEDDVYPPKPFLSDCRSPPASVLSGVETLQGQIRMTDTSVGLKHFLAANPLLDGLKDSRLINLDGALSEERVEYSPHVSESSCSPQSACEGLALQPLNADTNQPEGSELLAASVKREPSQFPTSASAPDPSKAWVKKERPYSASFQLSQDRGQTISSLVSCSSSSSIKAEATGQSNGPTDGQHPPPFSTHTSAVYPTASSPSAAALLAPPPRRTPKQHNCNTCRKNFSSASALQIHERTHTGEKPFVCSVCGRAFTTKGNLKVHMGTHMWSNVPARRGRRLSVENTSPLQFGEAFWKDAGSRSVNVDGGFWNRYTAAISDSLAMKTNEISVIQNRSVAQLRPLTATITGLSRTRLDLGNSRHFSVLVDDLKEI